MASNIDPAVPPLGNATTSGVRNNFAHAKSEIEALQAYVVTLLAMHGFFNYSDLATQTTPIAVGTGVWTKLTNDAAGPATHHNPSDGVTMLWDAALNQFDFGQLPLDAVMDGRFDFEVTTTAADQQVDLSAFVAIGSASAFEFPLISSLIFKVAGTYKLNAFNSLFVPNVDVQTYPTEIKIRSDAALTVKVGSFFVRYVLS